MTKTVIITLPVKDTDYQLTIYYQGKPVREPIIIPAGTSEITVELTGSGLRTYVLYIDGVALDEKLEVDFDNG